MWTKAVNRGLHSYGSRLRRSCHKLVAIMSLMGEAVLARRITRSGQDFERFVLDRALAGASSRHKAWRHRTPISAVSARPIRQ